MYRLGMIITNDRVVPHTWVKSEHLWLPRQRSPVMYNWWWCKV